MARHLARGAALGPAHGGISPRHRLGSLHLVAYHLAKTHAARAVRARPPLRQVISRATAMAAPADNPHPAPDPPDEDVRWPAYFQRSQEPLFLLNRRRRLVFVNRAWEKLTGLEARSVRGLVCKARPKDPGAAWQDLVQSALAPPPETLGGKATHLRRLVPKADHPGPQWWDVHFFPLMSTDGLLAILGKIVVVPSEGIFEPPPLPERIIALRNRRADHHGLESLQSEVPA